jgi:hypothetical protein
MLGAGDPSGNLAFGSATLGEPTADFTIGEDFPEANQPAATDLEPTGGWSAPILVSGQPSGVVKVTRTPNGVFNFMVEADVPTAVALSHLDDAVFVTDGLNGTFVVDGETVTQINEETGPEGFATSTDVLQAAVETQRTEIDSAEAAAGGPVYGFAPIQLSEFIKSWDPVSRTDSGTLGVGWVMVALAITFTLVGSAGKIVSSRP